MTTEPVAHRIERIRARMDEITDQLVSMDVQTDAEKEDPAEQAELLAKVTELRDEHHLLEERLAGLLEGAQIV